MVSTRQTIACVLLVLGITVCGYSQTAADESATISGKVTLSGNAAQGVVITLRSNEPASYRKLMNERGVTDAKGEYRIMNVPPGNYTVVPAAGAFVAADGLSGERTVIVNKAETIENFDFSLMTGGVITGRVVDADGRAIVEEEIHLFSGQRPNRLSRDPAAVTDDRGVYRIYGLKPGSYKVAAGREGDPGTSTSRVGSHVRTFYPAVTELAEATAVQVTEQSEATDINITLSRMLTTYKVSGRIVDGDTGEPLPNVNYGFRRSIDSTSESRNFGALTNERGEFKLENLPPGQYAVFVGQRSGSYFRAKDVPFAIVDRDVTGLEVRTLKGASVSGVLVLDGTYEKEIREQFLKTSVFAMVEHETTRTTRLGVEGTIRPNGSFRIGGLAAGTATFSLGASRFAIVRVEQNGIVQLRGVLLKQGEDVSGLRIFVDYRDASLGGAVQLVNGPLPPDAHLNVTARRLNDVSARIGATAKIDDRGQFVFDALLPGTYEVMAAVFLPNSRGPIAQTKQQVTVISGSTSKITFKLDLKPPKPNP